MGFPRQEYWSGLPCPPPGDLPDPEIKPSSHALQADSLPTEPLGKPSHAHIGKEYFLKGGQPEAMVVSGERDRSWGWGRRQEHCSPFEIFASFITEIVFILKCQLGDFPGGPVFKTVLPLQGTRIPSLVRELRSSILCSQKKCLAFGAVLPP